MFQTPLVLYFFHQVLSAASWLVPVVFVSLDLVTAWILYKSAGNCLKYLVSFFYFYLHEFFFLIRFDVCTVTN